MLEVNFTKKLSSFELSADFKAENEIKGILGHSGSGKSMVLKCIAGIEKPDKGYIRLNGRTLFDSEKNICVPTRKRSVGYLFQDYALFPNMTVEQNILCGCAKNNFNEAYSIIKDFGLEEIKKQYPHTISGGQKQRTALARMIMAKPDIMLFDEPFSALDESIVWQLYEQIYSLAEKNKKPMLFVSHSRDDILSLCKSAVVLERGKIIADDECKNIFSRPKNIGVAKLCGFVNVSEIKKFNNSNYLIWGFQIENPQNAAFAVIPEDAVKISTIFQQGFIQAKIIRINENNNIAILALKFKDCDLPLKMKTDLCKLEDLNVFAGSNVFVHIDKQKLIFLDN